MRAKELLIPNSFALAAAIMNDNKIQCSLFNFLSVDILVSKTNKNKTKYKGEKNLMAMQLNCPTTRQQATKVIK